MPLSLLVVDDDPLIQDFLAETFTEAGYSVVAARDGTRAIDLLEHGADPPDVLIADLNLGPASPDGWQVARRAREIRPELPVIYITGGRYLEWRPGWAPEGVPMLKPFTAEQMLTVVSALLDTRGPRRPDGREH